MPLYIRDDSVNELAGRLANLTGRSKTEAVREAIEERLRSLQTPAERLAAIRRIQDRARKLGIGPDGVDDKPLMDELSGGL